MYIRAGTHSASSGPSPRFRNALGLFTTKNRRRYREFPLCHLACLAGCLLEVLRLRFISTREPCAGACCVLTGSFVRIGARRIDCDVCETHDVLSGARNYLSSAEATRKEMNESVVINLAPQIVPELRVLADLLRVRVRPCEYDFALSVVALHRVDAGHRQARHRPMNCRIRFSSSSIRPSSARTPGSPSALPTLGESAGASRAGLVGSVAAEASAAVTPSTATSPVEVPPAQTLWPASGQAERACDCRGNHDYCEEDFAHGTPPEAHSSFQCAIVSA